MRGSFDDGGGRRGLAHVALLGLVAATVVGCVRDPLDPHGKLVRRAVSVIEDAEVVAKSRRSYERARVRAERVRRGMSVATVETVMGAFIAVQADGGEYDDPRLRRRKLLEGHLCTLTPSDVTKRWLFGFEEGKVELVGFALEFGRDNPKKEKWVVRRVDWNPQDACPEEEV